MRSKIVLATVAAMFSCVSIALAEDQTIAIGEWRTEAGKSLVCGGEEADTIITIATRANTFYKSGGQQGSAEYDAYWSHLEKAFKERRCFVTTGMRHLPDSVVYAGPEDLETQGKRFKVIGTTIEEEGENFPAFTMTTQKIREK
jgi:hypothetical protein